MNPATHLSRRLWHDQYGGVVSMELVSLGAVAVLGLAVALTSIRDAVVSEFSDVTGTVQDFNQSYSFNSIAGQAGSTAGSSFADATDHGDTPEDVAGAADNCILMDVPPTDEGEIASGGPLVDVLVEAESDDVTTTTGGPTEGGWNLYAEGQIFFDFDIPEDGNYTFSSRLWASVGGDELANAAFAVNGTVFDDFDIAPTTFADAEIYSVGINLSAGNHQFAVIYTNDFYEPPIDRNLFIDWLSINSQ